MVKGNHPRLSARSEDVIERRCRNALRIAHSVCAVAILVALMRIKWHEVGKSGILLFKYFQSEAVMNGTSAAQSMRGGRVAKHGVVSAVAQTKCMYMHGSNSQVRVCLCLQKGSYCSTSCPSAAPLILLAGEGSSPSHLFWYSVEC